MTQQPFGAAGLRGAVDLGALAAASQRKASPPTGSGAGGFVVDVTEADFQTVVIEQSMTVPVVVDLATTRAQQSAQMSATLDALAAEFGGAFLVARVDVDTSPALVQAFQVETLPFIVAVISGQPVPLAVDVVPQDQLRQILGKLLEVAAQNGVTGRLPGGPAAPGAEGDTEPAEPELPPLHQAAYDAIERGDLAAAAASYEQAIRESPADDLAAVGLVNVQLMQRTEGVDTVAALATAAAAPDDTEAQLLAADVELMQGEIGAAFDRLVEAVRSREGAERDEVRRHLVDLFALVGPDDPEVRRARIALTNALF